MHAIGHYTHAIWASHTPLPYSQSKVLRLVISTPWVLHLSLPWGSLWAVVSEIPALHDRPGVNDHNELWGHMVHNVVSIAVIYSVWQLRIQWRVVLVPDLQLTWIATCRLCTPIVFDKCNCKQNLSKTTYTSLRFMYSKSIEDMTWAALHLWQ